MYLTIVILDSIMESWGLPLVTSMTSSLRVSCHSGYKANKNKGPSEGERRGLMATEEGLALINKLAWHKFSSTLHVPSKQ